MSWCAPPVIFISLRPRAPESQLGKSALARPPRLAVGLIAITSSADRTYSESAGKRVAASSHPIIPSCSLAGPTSGHPGDETRQIRRLPSRSLAAARTNQQRRRRSGRFLRAPLRLVESTSLVLVPARKIYGAATPSIDPHQTWERAAYDVIRKGSYNGLGPLPPPSAKGQK